MKGVVGGECVRVCGGGGMTSSPPTIIESIFSNQYFGRGGTTSVSVLTTMAYDVDSVGSFDYDWCRIVAARKLAACASCRVIHTGWWWMGQ